MTSKDIKNLTGVELEIMEIIWQKNSATVNDVLQELRKEKDVAHSTVLTYMRILENKGYLEHKKKGRAFVYYPVVNQMEATKSILRHVSDTFFKGSSELLLLKALEHSKISKKELQKVKDIIKKMEEEGE